MAEEVWRNFCMKAERSGLTQNQLPLLSRETLRNLFPSLQIQDPIQIAIIEAFWAQRAQMVGQLGPPQQPLAHQPQQVIPTSMPPPAPNRRLAEKRPLQGQQDEWVCQSCLQSNWATRPTCRRCGKDPSGNMAANVMPSMGEPTTMRTAYSYQGTNVEAERRNGCWNCGSTEHRKNHCQHLDNRSAPTVCPCKFQFGSCKYDATGCRFLGLPVASCAHFLQGKCRNQNCTYAHRNAPGCPHVFQKGRCKFANRCELANRPVDECCFAQCTRPNECPRRHTYHSIREVNGNRVYVHPTKQSQKMGEGQQQQQQQQQLMGFGGGKGKGMK